MGNAVGMVEVRGLPPALAVADVMAKAARVILVEMGKVSNPYNIAIIGRTFTAGEVMQTFARMSMIKPFLLLFVLERLYTAALQTFHKYLVGC